ncbi:MAG: hypothetical protein AABY18_07830 [Candidatus Thermoplasmatota archaeon]
MYGILRPSQAHVPLTGAARRGDLKSVTAAFLRQAQRSALARFAGDSGHARGCHTAQVAVRQPPGALRCSGAIVAHVSPGLVRAWAGAGAGSRVERRAHVMGQLQLVLKDLSDHDVHGYLALTHEQREVYANDLAQLVDEGLRRTTFATLKLPGHVHWEGTLVRSLQPPAFVLVISIAA